MIPSKNNIPTDITLPRVYLLLRVFSFRVPALGGKERGELLRLKAMLFPERGLDMAVDWSLLVDKRIYYQLYKIMPTACLEMSILEMWGYNATIFAKLTDEDVINAINTVTMRYCTWLLHKKRHKIMRNLQETSRPT